MKQPPNSNRSLLKGLAWMGGLSLLSGGIVGAQTEPSADPVVVPAAPIAAPAPNPEPAPVVRSSAPVRPRVDAPVAPAPVRRSVTASEAPAVRVRKPQLLAPRISAPLPAVINPTVSPPESTTTRNNYIDRTDYNLGATRREDPAAVVLTERSSGCRTTVKSGVLSSGICGSSSPRSTVVSTSRRSVVGRNSTLIQTPGAIARRQSGSISTVKPTWLTAIQPTKARLGNPGFSYQPVMIPRVKVNESALEGDRRAIPLFSISTLQPGVTPLSPGVRPPSIPGNGNTGFLFPLTIPAPITSLFGWRMHPLAGTYRFHYGTDLGAAMGTPVVAAFKGQVAVAEYSGGYGLMVVLRHGDDGNQETRYAHLSEIFVQPGEIVEQGMVIGKVGSTGSSTGPHLHFEWRTLTPQGWVAVDSGQYLEVALAQLLKSMQTAQAKPQRGV